MSLTKTCFTNGSKSPRVHLQTRSQMRQTLISQACQYALQNDGFAHGKTEIQVRPPKHGAGRQALISRRRGRMAVTVKSLPAQQVAVENPSSRRKQVLFFPPHRPSSTDSLFVRGKQATPESQSGIRELHGQVSRCREPPCRSLNVHMCAALLSHLQDRWFITGEPQGQGPSQRFCCHGSRCWKERISFQCRLQMLGRGLGAAALCSSRFVIYRRTREQETCVGFSDFDPTLTHTLPFNDRKRTFSTWNVVPS